MTVKWYYYDEEGKIYSEDVIVDSYYIGETITERPLFRDGESYTEKCRWSSHPSVMGTQNIDVYRQYLLDHSIYYHIIPMTVNQTQLLGFIDSPQIYCLLSDSVEDLVPAVITDAVNAVPGIYISYWRVETHKYWDNDRGVMTTRRDAEAVIYTKQYNVYYYDVNDTYDYYLSHMDEKDEYENEHGTDAFIAMTTTLVFQDTFVYGTGIRTDNDYAYSKVNCHSLRVNGNKTTNGLWYVNADGKGVYGWGSPACDIDVYRYGCPDYWDDSTDG